MPDKRLVDRGCSRAHHAVDPLRVIQRLINIRAPIMPAPGHVQVIRALQWDRARKAVLELRDVHSAGQGDLAGHRGAADDGLVEAELVADGDDGANVDVFVVCVGAGVVALAGEGAAVAWQVEAEGVSSSLTYQWK